MKPSKSGLGALFLFASAALVFLASWHASHTWNHSAQLDLGRENGPMRVVSLSPSITETMGALGLEGRLVGVTRYCRHPESVKKLPKVGGYFDTHYEAILRLQPDLVLSRRDNPQIIEKLQSMGLRVESVEHRGFEGIFNSFVSIGRLFGGDAEKRALELRSDILRQMKAMREKAPQRRPSVLITVERDAADPRLRSVYAAGKDRFYDRIIEVAGGVNAYQGKLAYPHFSVEGLGKLSPDIVLDLQPALHLSGKTPEEAESQWSLLRRIPAVANGQVHVIDADYATVPGPRIMKLVKDLHQIIEGWRP